MTRWYGLLIDIDDRKNMEEALRSSQTRLSRATQTATVGEFAAAIAHEINQPLAAVVANGHACLRWLSAQPPGLAKAQEAAERIVRDGKEAGEVVRRIRALFKQAALEKIELDLNEVIGEVLHLLSGETARRRVAVETDLGQDLAPVVGDRVQLQQLVFNLLLNGIEAMDPVVDRPKKPLHLFETAQPGNRSGRDTGLRHRPEGSGQNLRSFLHHQRKRNGHGVGDLPLHHRCPSRPVVGGIRRRRRYHLLFYPSCPERSVMNSDSPVVFVVDDDHRVREALSSLISSVGLRVAVFGSAAEFLESEKPDAPACLVLDLQLPGTSGLELQQQLLAGDTPPIVFISGHGDIPSSVRAMKAGAIEFLSKPFDDQELLRAIDAAIDRDRTARQKRSELAELQRHYKLLTPREREVLPFVVAGFANKQTAADLGTSEITIGVHRGQIMRKMAR